MKILVIPDTQVRPGDDVRFLKAIGNYIVSKQPDQVVCLGDWADMASLSSYDVGKKSFEGRRYLKDVEAAKEAMHALLQPIHLANAQARVNKQKQYKPKLTMLYGNHEHRITKAVNNDAKLEGVLKLEDLGYEEMGWKCHPFLEVVVLEGVAFSHYFVTGVAGRPASSALAQFRKTNMSCVAGHQQGLQMHIGSRADGKHLTSIIAGSCYLHDEEYMGPQSNRHWRGLLMLHNVVDGEFDTLSVPLSYVCEKYGS